MGFLPRAFGALLVVLAVGAPAASAATTAPVHKGVKLPLSHLKRVSNVTCGKIGGKWYPGNASNDLHFKTYSLIARDARAAAKRLTGKARAKKIKSAKHYERAAKTKLAICQMNVAPLSGTPYSPPPYTPSYPGYVGPSTDPVRFNLAGAVGIASRQWSGSFRSSRASGPVGSNLSVVDTDGSLHDAVVSGTAVVGQFLIAPNNKLYVLFSSPTRLDGASSSAPACLLAEVPPATGVPVCIDSSLSYMWWNSGNGYGSSNAPIQFDDAGNIYYMGNGYDGHLVLRRYSDGVLTDLVTDNAYASDFVVLGDGTVVLSGTTTATSAPWVRRISPQGSLHTLKTSQSSFLRVFPDGNVYFGMQSGGPDYGVERYLPSTDTIDPQNWIGQSYYGQPHYDVSSVCTYDGTYQAFCGSTGASIEKSFTTTDGKVFMISGYGSTGQLMQYFPTLARPTTVVGRVAVAQSAGANIALSGLDSTDHNVTTLYDTAAGTERQLIGADSEIEVYHLNYVAADNKIMFDGLRFADNKYILGQVDLATGALTTSTPTSSRLTGFETFR